METPDEKRWSVARKVGMKTGHLRERERKKRVCKMACAVIQIGFGMNIQDKKAHINPIKTLVELWNTELWPIIFFAYEDQKTIGIAVIY